MIAEDNPMMNSFVGTVKQLTAEEKVAQACEMRRRYFADIATYEYEIAQKNAELAEIKAEIANKDAEIARLKALLEAKSEN